MICLSTVKRFCKEYWKIENYQEAVNDTEQVWDCHHRHEIDWVLPREELIAIGRYYDVHYSELIFLTHREHAKLHAKVNDLGGQNNPMRGKTHTEEWKQKMRGKTSWNKGIPMSDEAKQKSSESHKGQKAWNKGLKTGIKPHNYIDIPYDVLYDLRVIQSLTKKEISLILKISESTVDKKLRENDIKLNSPGDSKKGCKSYQYKDISREVLYNLRIEKKLPINEIAKIIGVSKGTIRERLKKFNIKK